MPTKKAITTRRAQRPTTPRAVKKTSPSKPRRTSSGDTAISSAAVEKATGKGWADWFEILDRAGAAKLTHREIAETLAAKPGVSAWWAQMITVQFERERGLRDVHQTARGFVASASRVVNVPLARLYESWSTPRARAVWLGKTSLTIRRATTDKSIRITWPEGQDVEVMFYAKSPAKSQVTVQHNKLTSAADVKKMKSFWADKLDALRDQLEA